MAGGKGGGSGDLDPAGNRVRRGGGRAVTVPRRKWELRGTAPAPQCLPSTALWLSSGSPQYSHFALGNASSAISLLRPSPRVNTVSATCALVPRGSSAAGRKRCGLTAPPRSAPQRHLPLCALALNAESANLAQPSPQPSARRGVAYTPCPASSFDFLQSTPPDWLTTPPAH